MIASGRPRSSGCTLRPAPSIATASSPAEMRPRQRVISMRAPANPSSAGRRVTDATMVQATVIEAPMPRPDTNESPMSSIPSSETTTVRPAKITERPAVSIARIVARSGVRPPRSPSRYRVTMKSA